MEEGECLIDGWDEPKIKAIMAQAKKDTIEAKKTATNTCRPSALSVMI